MLFSVSSRRSNPGTSINTPRSRPLKGVMVDFTALGGVGIISVASNEIPREMAEMTRAALSNDWDTARRVHRKYLPLMQANFIESNPLPVKALLAMDRRMRAAPTEATLAPKHPVAATPLFDRQLDGGL